MKEHKEDRASHGKRIVINFIVPQEIERRPVIKNIKHKKKDSLIENLKKTEQKGLQKQSKYPY